MTTSTLNAGRSKPVGSFTLPHILFGTSWLGNSLLTLEDEVKCKIINECVSLANGVVVFDTAGKYGSGIALKELGKCLKQLDVPSDKVIICNKLGWFRTKLNTEDPKPNIKGFENLNYEVVQEISYDGILDCFYQGNDLLCGYIPQMVAVHDPDIYMAAATNWQQKLRLYEDILDAYEALYDLKHQGKIKSIGVAAKDWQMMKRIADDVPLDWVMITNSMTIKNHPPELLDFIFEMGQKGISVINDAMFHSDFLANTSYYHGESNPSHSGSNAFVTWEKVFFALCEQFNVNPIAASIQFALQVPGISSITLDTNNPMRIKEYFKMTEVSLSSEFWKTLEAEGLIHGKAQNPYARLKVNSIN